MYSKRDLNSRRMLVRARKKILYGYMNLDSDGRYAV